MGQFGYLMSVYECHFSCTAYTPRLRRTRPNLPILALSKLSTIKYNWGMTEAMHVTADSPTRCTDCRETLHWDGNEWEHADINRRSE